MTETDAQKVSSEGGDPPNNENQRTRKRPRRLSGIARAFAEDLLFELWNAPDSSPGIKSACLKLKARYLP